MRHEARMRLTSTIIDVLTQYPDLAGDAAQAISVGVGSALDRARQEAAEARMGMSLALALLPPNRISDEARNILTNFIGRVIGNPSCEAERKFMETTNA